MAPRTEEDKAKRKRKRATQVTRRRATRENLEAKVASGITPPTPTAEPRLYDAFDCLLGMEEALDLVGTGLAGDRYRANYASIAREMCALGATDVELARAFNVSLTTMWGWQTRHPEFYEACLIGEKAALGRVERALYHRAVGYTFPEVDIRVVANQLVMTPVLKHIPPDVGAAKMILKAHDRKKWGDEAKLELSGDEAFSKMWALVSQGATVPVLDGPPSGGEATE